MTLLHCCWTMLVHFILPWQIFYIVVVVFLLLMLLLWCHVTSLNYIRYRIPSATRSQCKGFWAVAWSISWRISTQSSVSDPTTAIKTKSLEGLCAVHHWNGPTLFSGASIGPLYVFALTILVCSIPLLDLNIVLDSVMLKTHFVVAHNLYDLDMYIYICGCFSSLGLP